MEPLQNPCRRSGAPDGRLALSVFESNSTTIALKSLRVMHPIWRPALTNMSCEVAPEQRVGSGISSQPGTSPLPLVVIYTDQLEATLAQVQSADGTVTQPIFSFPGGRRFHFRDPTGNELAVWSDK